jgi:hypothetical protein
MCKWIAGYIGVSGPSQLGLTNGRWGKGSPYYKRNRGIAWEWDRIEIGPLQGLSGNCDDAGKWWARSDWPNRAAWVVPRTVGTSYSLSGGVSMYFYRVDKGFPWPAQTEAILRVHVVWMQLISVAPLTTRSMYLDVMDRILVSWSWMQCPRLMLCSATTNLSGWAKRMCRWCSLILVSMERPDCPM